MPSHLPIRVLACALLLCASTVARADKSVDHPEGWQTWTWAGNCYAIDYAKGPNHPGVQNGDTFLAIKHLPREHNYDNVSVVSGFGDITGVSATLTVGDAEFPLLVYGNSGFVRSGDPERKLIDLLSKSSEATVTWFKKDGMAVQTYDVRGFILAKKTIDTGCPHVADSPPVVASSADEQPPRVPVPPPAVEPTKPAPAKPASAKPAKHGHRRH